MESKDEILEAAMLARMVGTQLAQIDHFTVEKTSKPANKINMHNFVAPLMGGSAVPTQYEEADPLVRKAYEGVNEKALMEHPDLNAVHSNIEPSRESVLASTVNVATKQMHVPVQRSTVSDLPISKSDVDSIRNSLNSISKTLAGILKHIQSK